MSLSMRSFQAYYIVSRPKLLLLGLLIGVSFHLLFFVGRRTPSQLGQLRDYELIAADDIDDTVSTFSPLGALGMNDWLPGRRRKILITGGASPLAQILVSSLLDEYTVHMIDIQPRPATLLPWRNVQYYRQPKTSISKLVKSNIYAGIIHLGGLDLETWCPFDQETEACEEVERKSTMEILEALIQHQKRRWWGTSESAPWALFAWGPSAVQAGAYNITQRTQDFEKVIRQAIKASVNRGIQIAVTESRLAIVRFSSIYGYPASITPPNSIDTLTTNGVISQHIQYDSDAPPLDLIHVDDAVSGLLRTIERLDMSAGEPGVEELDFVSGNLIHRAELVRKIRELTSSTATFNDIGQGRALDRQWRAKTALDAKNVLNWSPSIDLDVGFARSISAIHQSSADWAEEFLQAHCPSTTHTDRIYPYMLRENTRNRDLTKLDGCTVNIAFGRDGYLDHLKCPSIDGNSTDQMCSVDNERVVAKNWDASTFVIRRVSGKWNRKLRVKFEEENGRGWLGLISKETETGLRLYDSAVESQTTFELEVNDHESSLRLLHPGSASQLVATVNGTYNSTAFSLVSTKTNSQLPYDMRMNLLCCPSEGDWPLLLDDYETADIRFGTTGQIPFNSSRRSHLCQRAEQALQWNIAQAAKNRDALGPAVTMSKQPHDWVIKDLPVCWNDCTAPTVCVQTGSCRCVVTDCPDTRLNPLKYHYEPKASTPYLKTEKSALGVHQGPPLASRELVDAVSARRWEEILLPSFRTYFFSHNTSFPPLHVVTGYPNEDAIESAECHNLQDKHWFSADSILYKAMRHLSVPHEEAELIVVPIYQNCKGVPFSLHRIMQYARETIPRVRDGSKKVALALTHDWGVCVAFAWDIWSARDNHRLYPDWILNNVLVWSVMGDFDSPCYRPHQDVVIPARTCQTKALKAHFGDMINVVPARHRKRLVTWSGTYWGTGKSERLRLTCDRGEAGQRELVKGGGAQSSWAMGDSPDYMTQLSSARFCPQPRGIAGWSPRVSDAIYAGCIPVITAEGSHYPWATQLDWSKFSVRLLPHQLDSIEQILSDIPLERVQEMQENLMLIRDAFIYSDDEAPEEELSRRGPMFWALHAAGTSMGTEYPSKIEEN